MFSFRYTGEEDFTKIDNLKFYKRKMFAEQMPDGSYVRPGGFFSQNRLRIMLNKDILVTGISKTMNVQYVGRGSSTKAIRINGMAFPLKKWLEVPVDFDSRDESGQDLFLILGFNFSKYQTVKENLKDCKDGNNLLIIRKCGGLGDIIMQSLLFKEIKRRFPKSKITYAIPEQFMPLYEHCESYIDHLVDVTTVEQKLYRFMAQGIYDFIGDISSSCAKYEVKSLKTKGFVDKERADIWAESIGLTLKTLHKNRNAKEESCINLTSQEIGEAKKILKKDSRPIIGFAPLSANIDRNYPYKNIQPLIDGLYRKGYRVILFHSHELKYKNCEVMAKIDLRLLGALISQLSLMISTDTGPLHYAGILGVPVIGLFGVTDSKVRLSYYNAVPMQGKCIKDKLPCWHMESTACRKIYSQGKINSSLEMKISSDTAACMYIEPDEIIKKAEEILNLKKTYKDLNGYFKNQRIYSDI